MTSALSRLAASVDTRPWRAACRSRRGRTPTPLSTRAWSRSVSTTGTSQPAGEQQRELAGHQARADDADLASPGGPAPCRARRPGAWRAAGRGRRRRGRLRSSSPMIRSASASSSASKAVSRSAVRAAAIRSSARYGAGAAPCDLGVGERRPPRRAPSQASPRSTSGRSTSTSPLSDRGGPGSDCSRKSAGLEDRVGDAELEGLRALQHPVLVEGVLDDHLERPVRRRSGSAAGSVPPQPGTRPRKHSGSASAGDAGRDRAVRAVQGQLDAAAHRRAVDEGEASARRARRAAGTRRGRPGRCRARRSRSLTSADVLEVGADREDERLAGDADSDDLAGAACSSTWSMAASEVGQAARAEGGRLGVVEAVVQRDQRERPAPPGRSTSRTWALRDDLVGRVGSATPRRRRRGGVLQAAVTSELAVRRVVRVLPDHRAAHADADAHRGQAVADLRVLLELPGQLGHQPDAGARRAGGRRRWRRRTGSPAGRRRRCRSGRGTPAPGRRRPR